MKRSTLLIILLLVIDACVDRIMFDIPDSSFGELVVDGLITDQPGPYSVKLSKTVQVEDAKPLGVPVSAKQITLFDDLGNTEVLTETSAGTFQTSPTGTRGVIGRTYHIVIETLDGQIFESLPDLMSPVGKIDSLYYQLEVHQPENSPTEYGYRIFVDASAGGETYVRWKFNGTYIIETKPQYKICESGPCSYCPLPCSGWASILGQLKEGYAYNPKTYQYEYVIGLRCTCCRCWITENENVPVVSNDQLVSNGKFAKVQVAFVPVNFYTFFEKYRVEVVQMSLSAAALEYWNSVKQQKNAIGSLFQPITGKIRTNVSDENSVKGVQGIFYASATTKRQLYLDQSTNRVEIYVPQDCMRPPREGAKGSSCLNAIEGATASLEPPPDWQ